jgi:hypothetical protein
MRKFYEMEPIEFVEYVLPSWIGDHCGSPSFDEIGVCVELLDILEYIEGPWLETNGVFFSSFGFLNQNWQAKCFLFSFC